MSLTTADLKDAFRAAEKAICKVFPLIDQLAHEMNLTQRENALLWARLAQHYGGQGLVSDASEEDKVNYIDRVIAHGHAQAVKTIEGLQKLLGAAERGKDTRAKEVVARENAITAMVGVLEQMSGNDFDQRDYTAENMSDYVEACVAKVIERTRAAALGTNLGLESRVQAVEDRLKKIGG